jgi:nitrate ABC transporter ATP-binding subunit
MPQPHLVFDHVGQSFRGQHVLDGVTLEVQRGEFVSLIGHSGCGKSTLLNLAAGLLTPSSGAVRFEGAPVAGPGPDRGMVFQHHSLLPWLSVYDNVRVAVDAVFRDRREQKQAERREHIERVLRAVRLWDHRHKQPGELSGGMRQRCAVARAFAVHPRLLLLDEPFGAIDALTRTALHEELLALWQLDSATETVLMVTHDIDEALYLSDRVVVMTNGPRATIAEIVRVDLPRPRDRRDVLRHPT